MGDVGFLSLSPSPDAHSAIRSVKFSGPDARNATSSCCAGGERTTSLRAELQRGRAERHLVFLRRRSERRSLLRAQLQRAGEREHCGASLPQRIQRICEREVLCSGFWLGFGRGARWCALRHKRGAVLLSRAELGRPERLGQLSELRVPGTLPSSLRSCSGERYDSGEVFLVSAATGFLLDDDSRRYGSCKYFRGLFRDKLERNCVSSALRDIHERHGAKQLVGIWPPPRSW